MAYVEYEADGKTIKARVQQKTDTLANWMANDMFLKAGEQAFVIGGGGTPINFKIGDGTKKFSELPWWISYDQGQYLQIVGNALPTPTVELGYSFVGPGTYTHSGGDVVAPEGRFSQIVWNGTTWSIVDMGELPVQDISGLATKEELKYNAPFNQNGYITTGGVVSVSADFDNTGHVFYKGGDIVVSGYSSLTTSLLFFYDKYFNPISRFETTAGVKNNINIPASAVPADTVFVMAQARTADNNAKLILSNGFNVKYKSITEYKGEILMMAELQGTVSTPTFDSDGQPINVIHRDSSNRIVRTDTFAFSETQITETRVFSGTTKTFTTELATLKTTIS